MFLLQQQQQEYQLPHENFRSQRSKLSSFIYCSKKGWSWFIHKKIDINQPSFLLPSFLFPCSFLCGARSNCNT